MHGTCFLYLGSLGKKRRLNISILILNHLLNGLGKRKAKATLEFPSPAFGKREASDKSVLPPKKIPKKARKTNKKKKRKGGRKARTLRPIPVRKVTEETLSKLDSVFLDLVVDEDERFHSVRNFVLVKALKAEEKRFRVMAKGPADKCPIDKLRDALHIVLADQDDLTLAMETTDHKVLCRMWVREVRAEIVDLRATNRIDRTHGQTRKENNERSVVKSFFESLVKDDVSHPRGASRGASPLIEPGHESPPPLVSCTNSSSSEFSSDASSEEEPARSSSAPRSSNGMAPLTLDEEARANLELLKACKEPEDIRERTATWVAKTMGLHLPSIMDMLQGRTPWPRWSQKRLFRACERISHTYTQAEVREKLGERIAEDARMTLLESEFSQLREIRLFLNLAQLGPGGSKEYLAKVTTEASRKDFEAAFHDPKAFKLFMQTLESVKAANSRARPRRQRSNNPRASSQQRGRRRPQQSRGYRARSSGHRGYRQLEFAPASRGRRQLEYAPADRYRDSSRRGRGRGARRRPGSRYSRSARGSNRRF